MQRKQPARRLNRKSRSASPRDHLFDVQIRTSTARRHRNEKVARWLRVIFLVAIVGAASFFGVRAALDRFFFQNTEYTLRHISFELDGILTREEAVEATGLHEGVNIFSVDLSRMEEALRTIPQVQDVRIDRQLPDQISVSLTARQPVAWVAAAGEVNDPSSSEKSLLIDANGFLMRPRRIVSEYLHLPAIYGARGDDIRDGGQATSEDLRQALTLLDTVSKHPEFLLNIRTLDISKGYSIEVVNDANAHITFAAEDFDEQLVRLQKLLKICEESGRTLDSVNLMVKRNTPVTFVMAAAPPVEENRVTPSRSGTGKSRKN